MTFENWPVSRVMRPRTMSPSSRPGSTTTAGKAHLSNASTQAGPVISARAPGGKVLGIVGRDGGVTARIADAAVIVPTVNPATVTPHAESLQAVIWHLLVSHPLLKAAVA